MTSSVPAALPDDHRSHDRLLIVRGAIEKLDPADEPAAAALLARCAECRELADDVRALRAELAILPAPARARDFRLSTSDADRLRGGFLQRMLAPIGGQSFAILQPLAGVAMALGLGLVVLTSISGLGAGGASMPAPQDVHVGAPAAAASPGASPAPMVGGAPQETAGPGSNDYGQAGGVRSTTGAEGGTPTKTDDTGRLEAQGETAAAPDWRVIGLVLLLGGAGLFTVRRLAAREADDPLLR